MSNNAKYILYSLLDFGLSYGGPAGVIIYNYISPDTTTGFKLSMTGIVLFIVLLLSAKTIFEHTYQNKINDYLQSLASATDNAVKQDISDKINSLKQANAIYQRLVMLMPFAILYVVCILGVEALNDMKGVIGLCLISMSAGGVFNVIKKPVAEQRTIEQATYRVNKKQEKSN